MHAPEVLIGDLFSVNAREPERLDLRRDPHLTAVRDRLDALPEMERDEWRALWAAVDEALAKRR